MLTAAQVLAQNNFGNTRQGGLAGPMGLLLILLLATATVLLIRNMNTRLRRLPDRFPDQRTPGAAGRADTTVLDPTDGTAAPEYPTTPPTGSDQHRNG